VARGELLAKNRRGITRFQITESIYAAPAPRGKLPAELVWAPLTELETLTLSGPHRRWVAELLAAREKQG
jgi:A/G-specific adenine glycosylase